MAVIPLLFLVGDMLQIRNVRYFMGTKRIPPERGGSYQPVNIVGIIF